MNRVALNEEEKLRFLTRAVDEMAKYTLPFIGSVIDPTDGSPGLHVGTALRLKVGTRHLVVSAHHVFQMAGARIAVSAQRDGTSIGLVSRPCFDGGMLDFQAYDAPPAYPLHDESFWPEAEVDTTDAALSSDFLFVHGFPGARSYSSSLLGGVVNRSLPYGVMRREDALPSDLKSFEFALDFDPANFRGPEGEGAEWLDPHGLSGSPVWRIGAEGESVASWTPRKCRLVGLVTKWKPDEKLLVATKLSACIPQLKAALDGDVPAEPGSS